jgi:hypothetical protein
MHDADAVVEVRITGPPAAPGNGNSRLYPGAVVRVLHAPTDAVRLALLAGPVTFHQPLRFGADQCAGQDPFTPDPTHTYLVYGKFGRLDGTARFYLDPCYRSGDAMDVLRVVESMQMPAREPFEAYAVNGGVSEPHQRVFQTVANDFKSILITRPLSHLASDLIVSLLASSLCALTAGPLPLPNPATPQLLPTTSRTWTTWHPRAS